MKVLVDTSIWSMALRRSSSPENKYAKELSMLIEEVRVQLIGPIRQEILSGIKSVEQYTKLRLRLADFPDLPIQTEDYEKAAEFYNICRKNGIQGSNTDFLICAVSANYQMPIFTTDQDFSYFRTYLPIELYELR